MVLSQETEVILLIMEMQDHSGSLFGAPSLLVGATLLQLGYLTFPFLADSLVY